MAPKRDNRPIVTGRHQSPSIWSPVFLFVFLATSRCVGAQSLPPFGPDPSPTKPFNPSTPFIIGVLVVSFFFVGFLSVYLRRCNLLSSSYAAAAGGSQPARRAEAKRGLDPATLASFPTIPYAEARELKLGLGSLECAVCLCEFEDDESLKMLPSCCHVYHPDCIDTWLSCHVTCPVCRSNLAAPSAADPPPEHVAIDVQDDTEEEVVALARIGSRKREMRTRSGRAALISRSRSMGNMAAGVERFTLRLPERAWREIVETAMAAGELRRVASCATGRSGRWISRTTSVTLARNESSLGSPNQV